MKFENSKSAESYAIGFLSGSARNSQHFDRETRFAPFFVLVGRFRKNFQPRSTAFFCQKVSGIQVLIEDSYENGRSLEVIEVMASNAFHTNDKVTSTMHQSSK